MNSNNENVYNLKGTKFKFVEENWNDFGYYTLFNCFYDDKKLGEVKIFCNLKTEDHGHVLHRLTTDDSTNKWMIGCNAEFYNELKEINLRKDEIDFLKQMNDLAFNPTKLEKLKKEVKHNEHEIYGKTYNMIEHSLFRNPNTTELYNFSDFLYQIDDNEYQEHFLELIVSLYNNQAENPLIDFLHSKSKLVDFYNKFLNSKMKLAFAPSLIKHAELHKNNLPDDIVDVLEKIQIDIPDWTQSIISLIGKNENVKKIIKEVDSIKSILCVKKDEFKNLQLGQYTSLKTLPYLISNKYTFLRFTNASQLNDPLEGKVLNEYLEFSENDKEGDYKISNIYVSSATSALDNLPMWKQYADDATGVCLIYASSFLEEVTSKEFEYISPKVYRVCYLNKNNDKITISGNTDNELTESIQKSLKNIKKYLKIIMKDTNSSNDLYIVKTYLNSVGYLFKRSEYAYENEYRLILDLKKRFDLIVCDSNDKANSIPFLRTYIFSENSDNENNISTKLANYGLPVSYQAAILGPKSLDIDYVAPYIKYCSININKKEIKVTRSTIKYR